MKLKKIITLLLCIALMLSCYSVSCFAKQTKIYGENIKFDSGKVSFDISVNGNPGIMGFRISMKYDEKIFKSPVVKKGNLLNSGIFENSASTTSEGSLDVIYAGTESFTKDGVLFNVTFDYYAEKIASSSIAMSYSQQDTFNDDYKDVTIVCEPIIVNFPETKGEDKQPAEPEVSKIKNADQDIFDAVKETLDKFGAEKVEDIEKDKQQSFVSQVEDKSAYIRDFEDIEDLEKTFAGSVRNEITDSISKNNNGEIVDTVIRNALSDYGITKVEDIPDNKKKEFIDKVISGISEFDEELADNFKLLSEDDAMEAIRANTSASDPVEYPEKSFSKKISDGISEHKTIIIIAASAVVVLVAAALYIKIHKKKGKVK